MEKMIVFENLDGFMKLLDAVQDKTQPVYIAKKNNVAENMILSGAVVLQFRYDDDVAMYSSTEDIKNVQLLPSVFMGQLSQMLDKPLMDQVNNAVKSKIDFFNGQLESEYQKAVSMVNNHGFMNVIQASLM